MILCNKENRAFFVYGFAKSERENIAADELEAFKELASQLLSLSDKQIENLLSQGGLTSDPASAQDARERASLTEIKS